MQPVKIFAAVLLLSAAMVASTASQTIVRQNPPRVDTRELVAVLKTP